MKGSKKRILNFKSYFLFLTFVVFILFSTSNFSCRLDNTPLVYPSLEEAGSTFGEIISSLKDTCNEDLGQNGNFNGKTGQCLCSFPNGTRKLAYYVYDFQDDVPGEGRYTCNPIAVEGLQYGDFKKPYGGSAYDRESHPWAIDQCLEKDQYGLSAEDEGPFYSDVLPCLNLSYFSLKHPNQPAEDQFMFSFTQVVFPEQIEDTDVAPLKEILSWLTTAPDRILPAAFLNLYHTKYGDLRDELRTFKRDRRNITQVAFYIHFGHKGTEDLSSGQFDSDFMKKYYLSHLGRYYLGSFVRKQSYRGDYYEPEFTLGALKRNLGFISQVQTLSTGHPRPSASESFQLAIYQAYELYNSGCFNLPTGGSTVSEVELDGPTPSYVSPSGCPPRVILSDSGSCFEDQCKITVSITNPSISLGEVHSSLKMSRSLDYIAGVLVRDILVIEQLNLQNHVVRPIGMIELNLSKEVSAYHLFPDIRFDVQGRKAIIQALVFDRNWKNIFNADGTKEIQISLSDLQTHLGLSAADLASTFQFLIDNVVQQLFTRR